MATYYSDYKNGNDTTGTGATGAPWKTLGKALSVVGVGDSIKLRGNWEDKSTYFREASLTTLDDNITIGSDAGHKPVICATTQITAWSKTSGRTNIYEAAALTEIIGAANDTVILTYVASLDLCDSTANSFFWLSNVLYVNIGGGAPTDIEAGTVTGMTWFVTVATTGVTIEDITFQWAWSGAIYQNANSGTIRRCTFRYQLYEKSTGHLVIRLYNADDVLIENCTMQTNPTRSNYCVQLLSTPNDRCTIRGCDLTVAHAQAFIDIAGGTGQVIEDTLFRGGGTGVYASAGTGTVRRCTFIDCASLLGSAAGTGAWTVNHNVMYNLAETGPHEGIIWQAGAMLTACHNIFYNLQTTPTNSNGIRSVPTANGSGLTIYNNIFFHMAYGIFYQDTAFDEPTFATDYNCFFDCTAFGNVPAGGQGASNILLNPQFVNPDNPTRDFRLLSISPCIDAGMSISGINDGFRGGAPDIGAFEYARPVRHGRR